MIDPARFTPTPEQRAEIDRRFGAKHTEMEGALSNLHSHADAVALAVFRFLEEIIDNGEKAERLTQREADTIDALCHGLARECLRVLQDHNIAHSKVWNDVMGVSLTA